MKTAERQKMIDKWCDEYCQICEYNEDRGTGHVDCQAEHEVEKDTGIECIHYEESFEHRWEMMDDIEREEWNRESEGK